VLSVPPSAEATDLREERLEVVVAADVESVHGAPLPWHRDNASACIDPQAEEKRLNIPGEALAARVVPNNRVLAADAGSDTAVGRPEVAQEESDRLARLSKHLLWNAFFPGATTETSQGLEPGSYRIANPVGEVLSRREVHLIPTSLADDTRTNLVSEEAHSELGHEVGQLSLFRRVLDRMPRKRAAVTDQVPEQGEFFIPHRLLVRPVTSSRQGDS
jgi:hypothetical protein